MGLQLVLLCLALRLVNQKKKKKKRAILSTNHTQELSQSPQGQARFLTLQKVCYFFSFDYFSFTPYDCYNYPISDLTEFLVQYEPKKYLIGKA